MSPRDETIGVCAYDELLIAPSGSGRFLQLKGSKGICAVERICFHPRESVLAVVGRGLSLWDVARRKLQKKFLLPEGTTGTDVAFGPSGKEILVSLDNGEAIAIRLDRENKHRVLCEYTRGRSRDATTSISHHPRKSLCAVATEGGRFVSVFNARTGAVVATLRGFLPSHHQGNSFHWLRVRFSPNGKWIAVNAGTKKAGGVLTLYAT